MNEQLPAAQYEDLIAKLQTIVERLESGELSLAESLLAYEEGSQLATACQQVLEQAELRVRQLHSAAEPPVEH